MTTERTTMRTTHAPIDRDIRVRDLPPWEPSRVVNGCIIEPCHPFLFCPDCGNEASANPADYWAVNRDTVFTCCGEPMRLVRRRVIYEDVEG